MLWDTWFIIRGPVDPDLRAIEKSAEMELFGHFVATYSTLMIIRQIQRYPTTLVQNDNLTSKINASFKNLLCRPSAGFAGTKCSLRTFGVQNCVCRAQNKASMVTLTI